MFVLFIVGFVRYSLWHFVVVVVVRSHRLVLSVGVVCCRKCSPSFVCICHVCLSLLLFVVRCVVVVVRWAFIVIVCLLCVCLKQVLLFVLYVVDRVLVSVCCLLILVVLFVVVEFCRFVVVGCCGLLQILSVRIVR